MINADVGEGMASDALLMPLLDMASVACGGHAGDPMTMRHTMQLAVRHGVTIGAHPSYPDREGFGRRRVSMPLESLQACLFDQLHTFKTLACEEGLEVRYVKPHGALYNDMMHDAALLDGILKIVAEVLPGAGFMLLGTLRHVEHRKTCEKYGLMPIFEVFGDRAYTPQGTLLARSEKGAVLTESDALAQLGSLFSRQVIIAHDGSELRLPMDSICVHGDNPAALATVTKLREMLPRA